MNTSLNLKDFRTRISDLARPNRFEVQIKPPSIYTEYYEEEFSMISWMVETAQIPQRGVGEIGIKFHGMEYKIPGDYTRENLTIGFINSYGWEGRNFFERWMELYMQCVNYSNEKTDAFDALDDSFIDVIQLGRTIEDDELASYRFYNVFPTNISAIDLNMGSNDEVQKFTVTFAYSHFYPISALEFE
jgi:hypothetical protein